MDKQQQHLQTVGSLLMVSILMTFSVPALTKNYQREKNQNKAKPPASIAVLGGKFDGDWLIEKPDGGVSLSVKLKQSGDQLTGEYGNVSSKESNGKILRAKIIGNTAVIEIDCDWGGRGTVKITRLKNNRLHWQVIKRDERKGQFIVLQNEILKKIK